MHNVFHTSLLEPYRSSTRGLRDEPEPVASTERRIDKRTDKIFINKSCVEHEIGFDLNGQRVYAGFFNVDKIMRYKYPTKKKKVLYLIKWEGYPEESEWTEELHEHLPRALVREFHARHSRVAMDAKLKQKARKGSCL